MDSKVNDKISRLRGDAPAQQQKIEIVGKNEKAESEMFSTVYTAFDIDKECQKYCGRTQQQIVTELSNMKKKCKENAKAHINNYFIESALFDIDLIFDMMSSMCYFSMAETFKVFQKILKRVEKILSENDRFYKMSAAEKNSIFTEQVSRYIPDWQLKFYTDLLDKEKNSAFSLYNDFISKVKAQDFIIRGDFINIQYDNNGNFMIVNMPDFLVSINTEFIEHMILSFMYGNNLKFGPSNAIVDLEDSGYRFNFTHKSLERSKQTSVFIRKNVVKSDNASEKSDFDFDRYYYDLFSEMPDDSKIAQRIIWKCNRAKKRLEYKFDGFKSKSYTDEPYGVVWYLSKVKKLQPEVVDDLIYRCDKLFNMKQNDMFDQFKSELYGTFDFKPYDSVDIEKLMKFLQNTEYKKVIYESIGERMSDSGEMDAVVYAVKGRMLQIMCNELNIDPMSIAKYAIIDLLKKTIMEKNPLICGPTGSGKSTLLSKVLTEKQLNEPEQNLITIEDTAELNVPNAISYITNKNYGIHNIFEATLRENPSRVVVGETRGAEIVDILETCLTSKSGSTIHATSFSKMEVRLKLMVGDRMSTNDLFHTVSSAIDIFVFIIARKVTGIYVRNEKYFSGNLRECYDRIL